MTPHTGAEGSYCSMTITSGHCVMLTESAGWGEEGGEGGEGRGVGSRGRWWEWGERSERERWVVG